MSKLLIRVAHASYPSIFARIIRDLYADKCVLYF